MQDGAIERSRCFCFLARAMAQGLAEAAAVEEEFHQAAFEGAIGRSEMISNAFVAADALEVFVVGVKFIEVGAAGGAGVDVKFAAGFDIVKEGGFIEGEVQFGAVECLEESEFVTPGAELAETFFQRIE